MTAWGAGTRTSKYRQESEITSNAYAITTPTQVYLVDAPDTPIYCKENTLLQYAVLQHHEGREAEVRCLLIRTPFLVLTALSDTRNRERRQVDLVGFPLWKLVRTMLRYSK